MTESLQFEVDEPQRLVDADPDGRTAGQHWSDDAPCFDKCWGQKDITNLDAIRLSCVGEISLWIDHTAHGRPVVESHGQFDGSGPRHASFVTHGQDRDCAITTRVVLRDRAAAEKARNASICFQILSGDTGRLSTSPSSDVHRLSAT